MKAAGRPIVNALRGRLYSAQAAAKVDHSVSRAASSSQAPQVTKLANGTVVASLENNSPVTRLAVAFNAGSRFESYDNQGVTHCIRNFADLTTDQYSGFAITKNLQQVGASLTSSNTRENIIHSLECRRDDVKGCVGFLLNAAVAPAFKHWEVSKAQQRLELDIKLFNDQPNLVLWELLHKAAFKNTLGNSLYAPSRMIGSYTSEQLSDYVNTHFTADRMAVVGVGVNHDELVSYANLLQNNREAISVSQKASYFGGEIRHETNSNITYAALGTEGVPLGGKDALAAAVLQHIMGTGPYVKYSGGVASSKVAQAAAQAATLPFAASCYNVNYSDTGLFGFIVAAHAQDSEKVLRSILNQFSSVTKGSISAEDLQRGKNQVAAAALMSHESSTDLLQDMASQSLLQGQISNPSEVIAAIDALTAADVSAVAKKIVNGKPTMAAVGNLGSTPYLDQLLS